MPKLHEDETQNEREVLDRLLIMENNIEHILSKLNELSINLTIEKLESRFVTKTEFAPIQKIVNGLVGLALTALFGSLIALIIKN